MIRSIWKFPCPIDHEFKLHLPKGAEILTWQMQGDTPCVWAKVDPDCPLVGRTFRMLTTGESFEDDRLTYIDTIQIDGGNLIFHLFEVGHRLDQCDKETVLL